MKVCLGYVPMLLVWPYFSFLCPASSTPLALKYSWKSWVFLLRIYRLDVKIVVKLSSIFSIPPPWKTCKKSLFIYLFSHKLLISSSSRREPVVWGEEVAWQVDHHVQILDHDQQERSHRVHPSLRAELVCEERGTTSLQTTVQQQQQQRHETLEDTRVTRT